LWGANLRKTTFRDARVHGGPNAILLVAGIMDLRVMAVVTAAITIERLAPPGERIAQDECRWMKSARRLFPVPFSPVIRIGNELAATRRAIDNTWVMAGDWLVILLLSP
jgi:hypothetical protein